MFLRKIILTLLGILLGVNILAQTTIKGVVLDAETQQPISDVIIKKSTNEGLIITDENGKFTFNTTQRETVIQVEHLGYQPIRKIITKQSNSLLKVLLTPSNIVLKEMIITADKLHTLKNTALSTINIDRNFILKNNGSTLSETLAKMPGMEAMSIGSGASKPMIRGLGFNRIAVVDKGIVIQNQQWGADHGMDIDQFDVDKVVVQKGPMSLYFGSDAMGGVIELLPSRIPNSDNTWGDAILITKSNNGLIGSSVSLNSKQGNWFIKGRITGMFYGDYQIPTDTIHYLTWKMPVKNGQMKNTAGRLLNGSVMINYSDKRVSTSLFLSDYFTKNGFFSGAHGIPDLRRLTPDGSNYNIELPFTKVNHFKISNSTEIHFDRLQIHSDIGFQQNDRQEWASFHTHYSNQKMPDKDPDKELAFLLNTYSANFRLTLDEESDFTKTVGINSEYQYNTISGYSFLLPKYSRISGGLYFATNYKLSTNWTITGGVRADVGKVNILRFYDTVLEEFLLLTGSKPITAKQYAERTKKINKHFNSFSGAIGITYKLDKRETIKLNIGRSFRFPTVNELASNGVHHGAFRHELGNEALHPEVGWQFDMSYQKSINDWKITVNPFTSYFSNYIYLNPTGNWSILPHAGQRYEYTEAELFLAGTEAEVTYQANRITKLNSNIGYQYSLNLDKNYPMPFSPPTTWRNSVTVSDKISAKVQQYTVQCEVQTIFDQNRIANNEEKTKGATLIHLSGSLQWKLFKKRISTELSVHNLFNTVYFNHLSFYRKLNAPEPSRNIQLLVKVGL